MILGCFATKSGFKIAYYCGQLNVMDYIWVKYWVFKWGGAKVVKCIGFLRKLKAQIDRQKRSKLTAYLERSKKKCLYD